MAGAVVFLACLLAVCCTLASGAGLSSTSVCGGIFAPTFNRALPAYTGFIKPTSTFQFADSSCQRVPIQGPNVWGWLEIAAGVQTNPPGVADGIPAGCDGITYVMSRMVQDGQPVARVRFHGASSDFAVETSPGVYNEAALKALDYIVYRAGQYGVKLLAVLADNWQKADSTYNYAMWATGTNQTDTFFANPTAIGLYQNHIKQIITRTNTITGVKYSEDPAIFAWDLINEPRSTQGSACLQACSQAISTWGINQAAFVRTLDANHPITVGTEGFWGVGSPYKQYNPSYSTGSLWSSTTGQDFDTQFLSANLFASYHYWPDLWGDVSTTFETNWIAQHDADAKALGKALVLSEFGKQYNNTISPTDAARTAARQEIYDQIFKVYGPAYSTDNTLQGVMFWRFSNTPVNSGGDANEVAGLDALYTKTIVPAYLAILKASGTATGCTKSG